MTFQRIQPYGPDSYTYWISGIYKIVSYRKASYHAYFIDHGMKTWGNAVGGENRVCQQTGNRHWKTLKEAKAVCAEHAKKHDPKQSTVKIAAVRLAEIKEKAKEHELHEESEDAASLA